MHLLPALPTLVVLVVAVMAGPAHAARPSQEPDTMTATVQQVNSRDSSVAVVYGVSLALTAVDFVVAPHCHVSLKGSDATLASLRPGQVVRVRYRRRDEGARVAEAIEVVRSPEDGP